MTTKILYALAQVRENEEDTVMRDFRRIAKRSASKTLVRFPQSRHIKQAVIDRLLQQGRIAYSELGIVVLEEARS